MVELCCWCLYAAKYLFPSSGASNHVMSIGRVSVGDLGEIGRRHCYFELALFAFRSFVMIVALWGGTQKHTLICMVIRKFFIMICYVYDVVLFLRLYL